ncbi:hypothetical protein BbINS_04282 [Bartonella bacilliformis INS]|uniref:Uncharacterized protein n=2 Tax=Bartonella bacilliformis TaxID=774 RepID=A1UT87_BARBK|nr:hypothetical protein BARBAKC583_0905 [Bartonella bacilliformis KC583]EKS43454.1 hypothetical protein BbINS_04282 [Bartonella bacilliformis INS]
MSPIIIKHFDNHYIFKKIQKENSFMIKIGKELIKDVFFLFLNGRNIFNNSD